MSGKKGKEKGSELFEIFIRRRSRGRLRETVGEKEWRAGKTAEKYEVEGM